MALRAVEGFREDQTAKRGQRARCAICERITRRLVDVGGGPGPDEAQWVPFCAHCEGEHDRTLAVGLLTVLDGGAVRVPRTAGRGGAA